MGTRLPDLFGQRGGRVVDREGLQRGGTRARKSCPPHPMLFIPSPLSLGTAFHLLKKLDYHENGANSLPPCKAVRGGGGRRVVVAIEMRFREKETGRTWCH